MATAHDVAAYILRSHGRMTAMTLQKLVYYAEAWALVWDEKPLFPERVEAWANGPVVPELYNEHRGMYYVDSWKHGNPDALSKDERETVDAILNTYGDKPSQWLSDLTHMEDPWKNARKGLAPGEPSTNEITHAAMNEYYSSL